MISNRMIDKLLKLLETELNIIRSYNQGCEDVHRYVVSKDWQNLEKSLHNLKIRAEQLSDSDNERELMVAILKKEMNLPDECSFGLLVSRFPQDKAREINDLKRNIRRSIYSLQGRIKGIGKYTESQSGSLKDVLDILIPDQKGKIYNRYGSTMAGGSNPLLVNRHF